MSSDRNFYDTYAKINSILQSEIAAVKLLLIRYGIDIDGADLERQIPGYPHNFRTKRAKKELALENYQLFDRLTGDIPYVPDEIYLTVNGHETVVKVNYRPGSFFKLICKNGSLQINCSSINRQWPAKLSVRQQFSNFIIAGFKADNFVQIIGKDRIAILGYDGCDEFYKKRQCLFCDSNPIRADEKSARPTLNSLYKSFNGEIGNWLSETDQYIANCREAYRLLMSDNSVGPHQHLHIMAGNLPDSNLEWDYMLKLSAALAEIKPLYEVDSYLNLLPPFDSSYLDKAKTTGFRKLIFNLEVYGEEWFKTVCSGKHAVIPYNLFK